MKYFCLLSEWSARDCLFFIQNIRLLARFNRYLSFIFINIGSTKSFLLHLLVLRIALKPLYTWRWKRWKRANSSWPIQLVILWSDREFDMIWTLTFTLSFPHFFFSHLNPPTSMIIKWNYSAVLTHHWSFSRSPYRWSSFHWYTITWQSKKKQEWAFSWFHFFSSSSNQIQNITHASFLLTMSLLYTQSISKDHDRLRRRNARERLRPWQMMQINKSMVREDCSKATTIILFFRERKNRAYPYLIWNGNKTI